MMQLITIIMLKYTLFSIRIAAELERLNPGWLDEKIFQVNFKIKILTFFLHNLEYHGCYLR